MSGYGGGEGRNSPGRSPGVVGVDPAEDLLSPLLGDSSGDGRDGADALGRASAGVGRPPRATDLGDDVPPRVAADDRADAPLTPSAFLRLRADDTDPISGLTHRDAASRLRHFGANETPSPPPPDERARLLRELRTPAARVVWFALLLQLVQAFLDTVADVNRGDLADDDTDDSAGAGRGAPAAWLDACALLLLLTVNALIARAEERTAEEATRAAVAAAARRAVVVRDGEARDVDAREIVPGDLVVVAVGDAAPADCRLSDASSAIVEVDVAALVRCGVRDGDIDGAQTEDEGGARLFRDAPSSSSSSTRRRLVPGDVLLAGAVIARGEARGVVIRTGAKTAMGERATRALRRAANASNATNASADFDSTAHPGRPETSRDDPSASAFDRAVRSVSRGVFLVSAAACGTLFATLLAGERFAGDTFADVDVVATASFVAALMVAAAPTATRAACAATAAVGCRRLARHRAVISRLSAAHTLARMDVLCVDDVGTLTADRAELRAVRVIAAGATPRDVLTAAALASRWDEPAKNAVDAMVLESVDLAPLRESYELVEHQPSDPTRPATESRIRRRADGGSAFRVCKGSPDVVAAMCDVDDATHEELTARLDECAAAGVRCLAVAANHVDASDDDAERKKRDRSGVERDDASASSKTASASVSFSSGWTLLGLVSFRDPPRADAARCVSRARELGVRVIVATRASAATTRETCRLSGLSRARVYVPGTMPSANDPALDRVAALAEASPEDKRRLVAALRERGWVVGAMGAGASNASAMAAAEVSVAADGATDAVRADADAALGVPGLATLAHAVVASRVVFAKVRNHVAYRVACAAQLLAFFCGAAVVAGARRIAHDFVGFDGRRGGDDDDGGDRAPWRTVYRPPVAAMVALAVLTDAVAVACAYDAVAPSRRPERWRLPSLVVAASVCGVVGAATSLLFLTLALGDLGDDRDRLTHHDADRRSGGWFAAETYGGAMAASHLETTLSCALTALSVRVVGPWYERSPGASLGGVVLGACVAATLLAVHWPFNARETQTLEGARRGRAMASVAWSDAARIWAWSVGCFLARDAAKVAAHRTLARAGWTPAPSGGRAVGGARWRAAQYLSRAETRRVEEAADDALAEAVGGRRGGNGTRRGGTRRREGDAFASLVASPGRRPWYADRSDAETPRRASWKTPVRIRSDDGEDGAVGFSRRDVETGAADQFAVASDDDDEMRPWAGLDDDDDEDDANGARAMPLTPEALGALGLLADAGGAGGSDYVSKWVTEQLPVAPTDAAASAAAASAAAAAAGRRLKPAPAPAQMVAAAADGVRARARRAPPRGGFRSPGSRDGAGATATATATATSSPSPSVAEAAADASVPRARRLTLHPEFVAAVADDYASIVAARDWRDALARVADEARSEGRRELKILDVGCGAGAFLAALAASGALDAFHDFGTGFGDAGVMDDEEETNEYGRDEGLTDAGRDSGRRDGRDYGPRPSRPSPAPAPAPRLRASLRSTSSSTDAVVLRVDLLDTSPSALRAASASLAPPLVLGGLRCATAREYASALASESAADGFVAAGSANSSLAISPDRRYDVVWAMHSLEHLPAGVSAGDAGLAAALRSIRALLRPGGLGFLAVAAAESHACRFRGVYRREFGRGSALAAAENARTRAFGTVVGSNPGFGANSNASFDAETELATAEHVVAALAARGASHNRTDASHVVVIDADDRAKLEAYLHGCAGDDAVSLDTMLANPRVGAYLASCRVPDGSKYAFPQKTAHITL